MSTDVFAEEVLEPEPARQSLGAIPTVSAPHPAPAPAPAKKRGGAAAAAARAPKPAAGGGAAAAPAGGADAGAIGAAAQQYGIPVALLKQPTSVAAYAQSYNCLQYEMTLLGMEIQENMKTVDPKTGIPKMMSPAKMKKFGDCKARKEKLEADMQAGTLTQEAYGTFTRNPPLRVIARSFF